MCQVSLWSFLYCQSLCWSVVGACTTGQIRLAGGNNNLQGRLEVCFAGQWATVTDDGWSTPDAKVVCRQLGFSDECETTCSMKLVHSVKMIDVHSFFL